MLDLALDLERFNRWMNDPVVAHFWEEQGDLEQHRERLESTLQNPSVLPLIGCIDGEPFGYFETYWAKEDRIGAYYAADDFDRGWHVLIGEAAFRGRPYVAAWMPSLSHYLFLDDCRTQRLVIEPRVDNAKMLRNLAQCGYAHVKAFDFPISGPCSACSFANTSSTSAAGFRCRPTLGQRHDPTHASPYKHVSHEDPYAYS